MTIKKIKLALRISTLGFIITLLFLLSNLLTGYPLTLPISLLVGNGLILLGNYIRYRKGVRGSIDS